MAEQKEKQELCWGRRWFLAKKDLQEGLVAETRRLDGGPDGQEREQKEEVDWYAKAKELYEGEELQKFVQVQEKLPGGTAGEGEHGEGTAGGLQEEGGSQEGVGCAVGRRMETGEGGLRHGGMRGQWGEDVQEKRVDRIVADTMERAEKKARVALEQEEEKKEKASGVVQKAKAEGSKAAEAPRRV